MSIFISGCMGIANVMLGPETVYAFAFTCNTPSKKTYKESSCSILKTVLSNTSRIKKGPFLTPSTRL